MRSTSRLDFVVNVATLLVCAVVVFSVFRPISREPQPPLPAPPPTLEKGDHLPPLADLHLERSDKTLLMVLKDGCKYCEASTSFYKEVLHRSERDIQLGHIQLVLLTPDRPEIAEGYLRRNGLSLQGMLTVTPSQGQSLKVRGTPTLILVNKGGTVLQVWLGKLDNDREREVLAALSSD